MNVVCAVPNANCSRDVLADEFAFLPSQIFASAFSAFCGAGGVSCSALSADFHIESMLLGKRFLERIHYRQIRHSPLAEVSYDSNHL
jgi:hypothetical protein